MLATIVSGDVDAISYYPACSLWRCRVDSSNLDRRVLKIFGEKNPTID